ncbi:glycoside hydrolase family 43 protein [Actinomarinicola tropica]|uniref:glycoside hydrolase family 43 protein n=1 Tax=Actinomarinicola tropica TaxID=2789776 RepID=UPI00189B3104|nr:glycoside hydrolase family 43 protein [Actinomarinicola tropica]
MVGARWRLLWLAVVTVLVAACTSSAGGASGEGPTSASTTPRPVPDTSTTTTAPPPPTTTTTAPAPTIDPAVHTPPPADPSAPGWLPTTPDFDMPNPLIVLTDEHYVSFATQTEWDGVTINVPFRLSTDLVTWSLPGDALPVLPPWAAHDVTWAPDVLQTEDGWVLFFTARLQGTELQCIGHAVGDALLGPYAAFDEPIVCPTERGGAIDPRSFVDLDGQAWLLWKTDDNWDLDREAPSSIVSQRLSSDGTALVGEPSVILDAAFGWEGHIVEAPDMVRGPDGRLWLLYSGGWFNQPHYGLGWAECATPAGPCTRHGAGRFLGTNLQGEGPGEGSIWFDRDGSTWIAYAPWAQRFRTPTPRPLALVRLGFGPDGPYLGSPQR